MKKKKKKSGKGSSNNGNGKGWTMIDSIGGPPLEEDGLSLLKLRQGEEVLIFTCTKRLYDFNLHYVDYPDLRNYGPYVHCNTSDGACVLCQIGKPVVNKYVTPVVPIETGGVKVLPISHSLEPFALLPQMVNIFKGGGSRHFVSIRRDDRFKFSVSRQELEDSMKVQIVNIIKDFMAMLKEGRVDIDSVYPRLSNKVLAEVPEINRILTAKGISYEPEEDY